MPQSELSFSFKNFEKVPDRRNSTVWEAHFLTMAKRNVENHGFLILAISNDGDHQQALNFIRSLEIHGYNQYLIACLDLNLFERLSKSNYASHVSVVPQSWLNTEITTEFVNFETPAYNDLTKAKTHIVRRLLLHNFTVLLNDVDLVWLSSSITDNLSLLSPSGAELIAMNGENMLNSGFYVVKPTATMKKLFSVAILWQNLFSGMHDQYALRAAIWCLSLGPEMIHQLDVLLYANGHSFFYLRRNEKTGVKPLVVHANFMIGSEMKISQLKKENLWFL